MAARPHVGRDAAEAAERRRDGAARRGRVRVGGLRDALRVDGQEGRVATGVDTGDAGPLRGALVELGDGQQGRGVVEGGVLAGLAEAELSARVVAPREDAALPVQRDGVIVAGGDLCDPEAVQRRHLVRGVVRLVGWAGEPRQPGDPELAA